MFDRNIGVFTKEEQNKIRTYKFGVLGCGGMGGISAQILARTGVESVILADPDKFEVVNINNQFGAFAKTIGENKAQVTARMLTAINQHIEVTVYNEGVSNKNVYKIISGCDIVLDCIDYNELYYSYIVSKEARQQNKFVLAPQAIGFGCSVLVFNPSGVSFNEYLGLKENLNKEDFTNIIIPPQKYTPIIPDYINNNIIEDTVNKRIPIPNIALAQTLAASIMVCESMFILLKKRVPVTVPKIIAIDLFKNEFVH